MEILSYLDEWGSQGFVKLPRLLRKSPHVPWEMGLHWTLWNRVVLETSVGSMVYGLVLNLAVDYIPIFRPSRGWFRVPTGPTVAMGMSLLQPVGLWSTKVIPRPRWSITMSPELYSVFSRWVGTSPPTELPPPTPTLQEVVLFSVSPLQSHIDAWCQEKERPGRGGPGPQHKRLPDGGAKVWI